MAEKKELRLKRKPKFPYVKVGFHIGQAHYARLIEVADERNITLRSLAEELIEKQLMVDVEK